MKPHFSLSHPAKPAFHRMKPHSSNSLWQPLCHRMRISIPPCQSELADAPAAFCRTPRVSKYTLRAMPSSATMEGIISSERRARPRGVFCCERQPSTAFPSGQMPISPDETAFQALPSGKNHDLPDGRPMKLARQFHFGSQCATERVYRYLPANVKLIKSHFGKQSLTECPLRCPPCQSELAEVPTVCCATMYSPS